MTESDFIKKWVNDSVPECWRTTAAEVYWIRAYKMEEKALREMALDLINAFEASGGNMGFSSSIQSAVEVTGFQDLIDRQ